MPTTNTLEQLLAVYNNPESHNTQRHRQTDRQTDNRMMPIADHTVYQYDRLKSELYSFTAHAMLVCSVR